VARIWPRHWRRAAPLPPTDALGRSPPASSANHCWSQPLPRLWRGRGTRSQVLHGFAEPLSRRLQRQRWRSRRARPSRSGGNLTPRTAAHLHRWHPERDWRSGGDRSGHRGHSSTSQEALRRSRWSGVEIRTTPPGAVVRVNGKIRALELPLEEAAGPTRSKPPSMGTCPRGLGKLRTASAARSS